MPPQAVVINKTDEVPVFLRIAQELKKYGDLKAKVYDIEGCYPNMPKGVIRTAMRETLERVREARQVNAVMVPNEV